jgi:aarF domain-containing kinase
LNDKYLSDLAWWYSLVTLQALGPAWQKLGQWAATRRDLFPQYICDRLSLLHDHGFAHSWKHTEEMLLEAFGEDYLARGLEIDALIGCGSAAQVYRGSLTVDGDRRPVAVKVLHPRFASLVERDLVLMQSAANLLNSLPISTIKVLDLPKVAQNFGDILRRQADLRIEARNLQVFRQNFYATARDEANSLVLFPKPVDEWTSSNILIEELVEDARPIAYYINDTTEEGWKIRKELALPLLRSFLKMVFIDSWVHAGKIILTPFVIRIASWF